MTADFFWGPLSSDELPFVFARVPLFLKLSLWLAVGVSLLHIKMVVTFSPKFNWLSL